jgi:hypothetical protein
MPETYLTIEVPIHPDDRHLPLSTINIRLPSGKLAGFCLPIQGEKTLDTAIAILNLWRPTLVVADSGYSI